MAEFQVLTTKRGGKSLIIDGYQFRFHQKCATKKQWKCVKPHCPSRCHTDVERVVRGACCSSLMHALLQSSFEVFGDFILIYSHFGTFRQQQRQGKMGNGEMLQGVMTLKGTLGRNRKGRKGNRTKWQWVK